MEKASLVRAGPFLFGAGRVIESLERVAPSDVFHPILDTNILRRLA
jgi:hypothetical protein